MAAKTTSQLLGSKPAFRSLEELQQQIDDYFDDCKPVFARDQDGRLEYDQWGRPIVIDPNPPTVTGLALWLGFKTRRALLEYKGTRDYRDTVLRGMARVEKYMEQQLLTREGVRGAMFSLQNNFGWKPEDKDGKGPVVRIVNDIPRPKTDANTETAVFNPLDDPDRADSGEVKDGTSD